MSEQNRGNPDTGTGDSGLSGVADAFERALQQDRTPRSQPRAPRAQEPVTRQAAEPVRDEDDGYNGLPPEIRELLDPEAGTDEQQDEGQDDQGDEPPKRKLVIPGAGENGEDIELDEDEVRKGYLRQADYTRKTMTLAERARMLDESAASVEATHQGLQQFGQINSALLQQMRPVEPNWDELRQRSPTLYMEARAQFDSDVRQWQGKMGALQQMKAQSDRAYAQAQYARQDEIIRTEHQRLVQALPELRDRERGTAFRDGIVAYATKLGLNQQDLATLTDHRALLVLDKARRFDSMMESAAKIKAKRGDRSPEIASATPGPAASRVAPAVTNVTRAKQAHAKVGSVKSATGAFAAILNSESRGRRK